MKILPAIALPLLLCGYCHAATTLIGGSIQNGNFESSGTGTVLFSTNTITNWANWAEIDTATNNTGVYSPGAGAPRNDRGAFIQPGGAIRNMTTYTAQVGDTFSYSFDFELAGRGAASMQLVYDEGGVITGIPLTVITSPTGTANTTSGTFTVQAGDAWVGKSIGVGLFTSNNFPEVDNVTLTVVPEPSVTLLGAVGVISLLRRRRA